MLVRATRRLIAAPLRALLAVVVALGTLLVPVQSLSHIANAQTQTGPTLTVNSTADPGDGTCTVADCTLREAVTLANTLGGPTTINFTIAGPAPHVINLATDLPGLFKPVVIDGLNGGSCPLPSGPLTVELHGTGATTGLSLSPGSNGSTVRGLAVTSFTTAGIVVAGSNNSVIACNFIGVKADGTTAGGNGIGVNVTAGLNSTIQGNTIANNSGDGIQVTLGTGHRISQNSIFSNGSGAGDLGIDLNGDGVTANDGGDIDTGPNNLQNFPVITSAITDGVSTNVTGNVDSIDNGGPDNGQGAYTVEFFTNAACDTSGFGEGKTFLGSTVVSIIDPDNLSGAFTAPLPPTTAGQILTATATDPNGNTSEFSQCFTITEGPQPGPSLTVNTAADHDDGVCSPSDCTLREAINAANSSNGHTINFNISGPAPHVINVASNLPTITMQVVVDGLNGGACPLPSGPLTVEIHAFGPVGNGLRLDPGSDGSTIRGLAITAFSSNGIRVGGSDGHTIVCNYLGVQADGTTAAGNAIGINVAAGTNSTIGGPSAGDGNVIANNLAIGVQIGDGSHTIRGNVIRNNSAIGIVEDTTATGSTIQDNTIRNNGTDGVEIDAGTGHRITQNRIFSNGSTPQDLGIDLVGTNGVNNNDPGDGDSGPNNLQNFPLLASAVTNGSNTTVTGTLDSVTGSYTLEFFDNAACDTPGGNGEGQVYLGTIGVTIGGGNPTGAFSINTLPGTTVGHVITATATAGDGSTSEFSACRTVTTASAPTVTTSAGPVSYTENAAPVLIDPGLTVADPDSPNLTGATVGIAAGLVPAEDVLAFTSQFGITGSYNATSGVLTLTGTASVANYQTVLRSVTYQNLSDAPTTTARTIAFQVTDDTTTPSSVATRAVTITAVDDPPVNTVPGAQNATEDTPLVFSAANGNAISVADVDAGAADVQTTLTVTSGTLALAPGAPTAPLTSVTGAGTATLVLTGTTAEITAALNGVTFTPAANQNGSVTLTVQTSDLGNTGTGGPLTDTDPVAITVGAVNDPPVNTVPGGQTTPVNTPLVFATARGNAISVADPDAGTSPMQVTLGVTAGSGVLALGGTANLTVSGNGTATVTATGSQADLNAGLQGLTFTPASGFTGLTTLTVTTNDQGNTGSGGPKQDQDTVQIGVGSFPRLAINDPAPVPEGNGGSSNSIIFTVTLTPASNLTVTVPYSTADQTATGGAACAAGVDYLTTSGTLTFNPGDTSKTIAVTLCGDVTVEPDETLLVNLGTATNAVVADNQGVGTIANDDNQAGLSIADATVAEADSGTSTLTFAVTLDRPSASTITVAYTTNDGTARGGASCAAEVDYLTTSGTLTFNPGDTSKTIAVIVCADTLAEGSETLTVNLSVPTNASIVDGQGVGTITDDDVAGTVAFSTPAVQVQESAGSVTLTVQRSGVGSSASGPGPATRSSSGRVTPSAISAITVGFTTIDGTARAGEDYTAVSGTLSFGVGETTKTITVPILPDNVVEGPETFAVTLSTPTGGATIGTTATVTVTIVDTTAPPPSPPTEPLPSPPPAPPEIKQGEDDTDKPRKETEEQRQQRQHTNAGNRDDLYTEGNVVEVHQGEVDANGQPVSYVVIANKDGLVRVNLLCGSQCPTIRVGDYLEADGEKQNEALFDATDVTVKHPR